MIVKHSVALFAVILAAAALPTDIGSNFANVSFSNLAGFGQNARGGQGGAVWYVNDPWALRDACNSDAPRIIYVRGRLDLKQLFTGSPGVAIRVGPNKSIIGVDRHAEIYGGGLSLRHTHNVVIQNLKFNNALSYGHGERPNGNGGIANQQPGAYSLIDAIEVFGSEHVWIDHCEFSDDPWNSASTSENSRRHDGLIDIVQGSSWVTVSNSIFRNHNLVSIVGNDYTGAIDRGRLKVTWYLNWFRGTTQRHPFVIFGEVHMLNNLYTDIRDYGIGIGVEGKVYAERNCFINVRRAWTSDNNAARLYNFNNWLVNSNHDTHISGQVGWQPSQYYSYSPMAAGNVEAHVRRWAGPR